MVEKKEGSGDYQPNSDNNAADANKNKAGDNNNENNGRKYSEGHNSYECFVHEEVKGEVGGTIGTRPQGLSLANQI